MIDVNAEALEFAQGWFDGLETVEIMMRPARGLNEAGITDFLVRAQWGTGRISVNHCVGVKTTGMPILQFPYLVMAELVRHLVPALELGEEGIADEEQVSPGGSAPIVERVDWWCEHGECGTSSKTISHVLAGRPRAMGLGAFCPHGRPSIPHDPDDLRRCVQLLDLIPEWVVRLPEVAERYPEWAPLVTSWPELVASMQGELPPGKAPKTYAMMQRLRGGDQ